VGQLTFESDRLAKIIRTSFEGAGTNEEQQLANAMHLLLTRLVKEAPAGTACSVETSQSESLLNVYKAIEIRCGDKAVNVGFDRATNPARAGVSPPEVVIYEVVGSPTKGSRH
jgi:hypothetical protein